MRSVGQRQQNGALHAGAQGLDHLLGEGSVIGGGSDENAGLDLLHNLQQANLAVLPFPAGNLGSRAGVFLLVVGQPLHVIGHQTVDVDQPDTLPGFFTAQAVTFHGGADLVGHAGAGPRRTPPVADRQSPASSPSARRSRPP